ncbi:sgf11, transcriptional regulation [Rhodotorula toruloides]|uniref:SAGA-associated factor 11 n=1 Tax=Rhodotorula toruloides TaxID=5286 RepID=A0A511KFE2_RHOTO|nr:sgf11, transcriptional regulation [Rhodotorula toruloides]
MAKAAPDSKTSHAAAALTAQLIHELIVDLAVEEHRLAILRRERTAAAQQSGLDGALNGEAGSAPANGTEAGTSPVKKDEGLFECLVCSRQIAAPRYASHLSGCMGLSGSRRGGERRAAAASSRTNGVSRTGSVASSYGSDSENAKSNGIKRSATASPANGAPKPKKPKPAPLSTPRGIASPFQPPHTGSHPLSKTMSLPSSPLAPSPGGVTTPRPLRTSVIPAHSPLPFEAQAPAMQARKSLPGSMGGPPPPPPAPAATATKIPRVAHPLAQSQPAAIPRATIDPDRPDSDSENSDDELVVVPSKGQGQGPQAQQGMVKGANGASAGAAGTATGHKTPRKVPPPGPGGRKAVARAVADSGSESDDDASAGSDSD